MGGLYILIGFFMHVCRLGWTTLQLDLCTCSLSGLGDHAVYACTWATQLGTHKKAGTKKVVRWGGVRQGEVSCGGCYTAYPAVRCGRKLEG